MSTITPVWRRFFYGDQVLSSQKSRFNTKHRFEHEQTHYEIKATTNAAGKTDFHIKVNGEAKNKPNTPNASGAGILETVALALIGAGAYQAVKHKENTQALYFAGGIIAVGIALACVAHFWKKQSS